MPCCNVRYMTASILRFHERHNLEMNKLFIEEPVTVSRCCMLQQYSHESQFDQCVVQKIWAIEG